MAAGTQPLPLQPMGSSTEAPPDNESSSARPASPSRATDTAGYSSKRHVKGLSLNFPILLPPSTSSPHFSPSPTASSALATPIDSSRSSPHTRALQFRHAETQEDVKVKPEPKGSGDFLTLLAAQERKVLELREELQKAESDLLALKQQWASYEATKKKDEVKLVKKLQPLALDDVAAGARHTEIAEEDIDEERRRKRAIVERSHAANVTAGSTPTPGLARKGSKRVFEGRHTRTLSLLSPTAGTPARSPVRSSTESEHQRDKRYDEHEDDNVIRPTPLRMPTLESFASIDALHLGFGKTYKDLAAHRRSLPPAATDLLVKQGRQVYDGVRDGLWTFFEDIRQATVGEEGVSGTAAQQQLQRQPKKRPVKKVSGPPSKQQSASSTLDQTLPMEREPSFWNEFGLETPHKPSTAPSLKRDQSNRHVQQKSSTDSSNPPSLLPDGNDTEGMDDGWDTWDSPVSNRNAVSPDPSQKTMSDSLPWPEIQKLTPSKLTRTVSDLMREWDGAQKHEGPQGGEALVNGTDPLLSSPHI